MDMRGTAFASDFDGTLCHSNWETGEEHYEPATLDAVRRYQEAGGLFGLCTGRPLFSVAKALEGILEPDFYIVTTGAHVANKSLEPLFQASIDLEVAQALFERYARDDMGFLAITDADFYNVGRTYVTKVPTIQSFDEISENLLGVSLEYHGQEERARQVGEELNALFGNDVAGYQNLGSIDVVAQGCSKGSGVEVVRTAFGLDCVVGIGDSYNDVPLLRAADVSYTFHASPQSVQDEATHVVEDLAEALDHFMAHRV